jgi:hypothetical protein
MDEMTKLFAADELTTEQRRQLTRTAHELVDVFTDRERERLLYTLIARDPMLAVEEAHALFALRARRA